MNTTNLPENSGRANGIDRSTAQPDSKWLIRSLLATAEDGIYFKDRKSRFTKMSPEHAKKKFGLNDPEAVVGKTDFDFFDEIHARKAFDDEQRIIATGVPLKNIEEMETWPDGTVTWCSTTKVAMCDDEGAVVGIVGISRDITERKLQERHLNQVTRIYAAMSRMYQAILRARTREQLFSGVCRSLVESAHFDMAWVGLAGPQDPQIMPAAKFGDESGYLLRVQFPRNNGTEGCGPVGAAVCEGTTQVDNHFQKNLSIEPWHAEAMKSGWQSCCCVPVRIREQVAGALSIYSKTPGYFGDKEVILLERASADISSALEMIDALAALQN